MFCRQSNSAVTQLTLIVNFMWCYSFCWTRAHEFSSAPDDIVSSDLWSHWRKPSFQLSFRLVTAAFLLSKSAAVLTLALPVVELYVNELSFFFFCLAAFVPQNVCFTHVHFWNCNLSSLLFSILFWTFGLFPHFSLLLLLMLLWACL